MEKLATDTKITRPHLVTRPGEPELTVEKSGDRRYNFSEIYVHFIGARWRKVLFWVAFFYILINFIYAIGYFFIKSGIENSDGSFFDDFFFSVQTFSSLGYGKMSPHGMAANILASLEVLTGFIFFAMVTGLMFAKFSHPNARVLFADNAVICNFNGKPHFMVRLANQRNNRIIDANVRALALVLEKNQEGQTMRRFYDLKLLRDSVPAFQFTWTLMHEINEQSPLFGLDIEKMRALDLEIIVSVSGHEEAFAQMVHARWSYLPDDLRFNEVYQDVVSREVSSNRIKVDYSSFNNTRPQ